jgi:hypothetical protein
MDVGKHDELDERKFQKLDQFLSSYFIFIGEDDEDNLVMPGAGPIAMHASNRDDPLLEIQDDVNILSFFNHINL